ncbi:SDR family NAD(P)-dependent oxidoreductase [Chitinophaga niabensis]|uniref:NAD(P)-dependent dehydrogenase, short-chain alcohol dehydrogenase family n=1 Tax=Chitinophaga niabensis TaxID=536979 RepID=A0A1N6JZT6_9BACT|nr:SDR family oxidoreductase [Chitinophaga niabensis]SIO49875.1 NAD(P)-dependent dehydrogenase, short-chain alcohol dehydrogenase family [Chitinophaga niabensis]
MILQNKHAVIYGGGGVIGSAVALAFAKEGAKVFLTGRTLPALEAAAKKIKDAGGDAEVAVVDALNQQSIEDHLAAVYAKTGSIDIHFNAIGVVHLQGIPLVEMSTEDFYHPVHTYVTTNFLTTTAVARYMIKNRSGVILTITTPGGLLANGVAGGFGVSNAAVESLTRNLAGELGAYNIRAIALRSDAIPETVDNGSHAIEVFGHRAELMGTTLKELTPHMGEGAILKRPPTLEDLGNTAAFLASDKAKAITATIANITCGSIVG